MDELAKELGYVVMFIVVIGAIGLAIRLIIEWFETRERKRDFEAFMKSSSELTKRLRE